MMGAKGRRAGIWAGMLAALLVPLAGGGCNSAPGMPGATAAGDTTPGGTSITAPAFDGKLAMEWLQRQVKLGPRVPGTPQHDDCQVMLLQGLGDGAKTQVFSSRARRRLTGMANLIGQYGPTTGDRILLCAHWDTRPFADQDPDAANRLKPILGANDGASGVAVLLEMARLFKASPPPVGVTIVLFDGEDFGMSVNDMFLGSRYYADHIVGGPFRYGILLDMVGDADLQIYRERNSQDMAPAVVDKVWGAAADLKHDEFRPTVKYTISDDHLPLQMKNIPVIDVIDFDYPPWHTLQDTADKCSADSLKVVGDVMRRVVYTEK